jgi:hypothetical protein
MYQFNIHVACNISTMLRLLTIITWILLSSSKSFSQTKEYKLLDKTTSSDINSKLVTILDTTRPGLTLIGNVFKPTKGKFTVYRFLATYQGLSFTNKQKEFHDILIVKVDSKNKIILAYQYTLEWAEPPLETDLYESTCKDTYLTDNLSIDKFIFERPWYYDKQDRKLKDSGNIRLIK